MKQYVLSQKKQLEGKSFGERTKKVIPLTKCIVTIQQICVNFFRFLIQHHPTPTIKVFRNLTRIISVLIRSNITNLSNQINPKSILIYEFLLLFLLISFKHLQEFHIHVLFKLFFFIFNFGKKHALNKVMSIFSILHLHYNPLKNVVFITYFLERIYNLLLQLLYIVNKNK